MTTDRTHRLQVIVAFALVYVFWGSTYLAIGIADDEHLPSYVMCALRFLIAGTADDGGLCSPGPQNPHHLE